MPIFEYKAIKESGEIYEGSASADNEKDLIKKVRKDTETLVSYEIQEGKTGVTYLGKIFSAIRSIKSEDKIVFAKNLGIMIGAGLSVSKALVTLEKQFKNIKFKEIIKNINFDIKKGATIHSAIAKYPRVFSPLFISMIKAGEESGKISESLAIVCHQMENSNNLRKKIKGALIYPIIIILAMIIIGILMLLFIVPTLQSTFSDIGVELPVSTQIIIGMSTFLRDNILISLFLVAFIGVGFWSAFQSKTGKRIFDFIILHIPIISGMVKEVNSARATRTLSSLLSSGVDVVNAFDITRDVLQNYYHKEVLAEARDNIQKGIPVADVFVNNEHLFPPIVGAMIEVGEETGKLPEMLLNVAVFYEDEVAQKTKNMSTIIEPFLMIAIGAMVGFFAMSMISPMYSLVDSI